GRTGGFMLTTRIMVRRIVLACAFVMVARVDVVAQSATVGELEKRLEEMQSQIVRLRDRVAELEAATRTTATTATTEAVRHAHTPEESNAFQYKGLSLTPGGFLEGTTLFRTRNENADIANSYSAVPLNGSSNARLSEFRGTARNSEFS